MCKLIFALQQTTGAGLFAHARVHAVRACSDKKAHDSQRVQMPEVFTVQRMPRTMAELLNRGPCLFAICLLLCGTIGELCRDPTCSIAVFRYRFSSSVPPFAMLVLKRLQWPLVRCLSTMCGR